MVKVYRGDLNLVPESEKSLGHDKGDTLYEECPFLPRV